MLENKGKAVTLYWNNHFIIYDPSQLSDCIFKRRDSSTRFSTLSRDFQQTIPMRPLIHGLKPVRIWICTREDI
jgi:hypothetical protein